MARRPVAPDRPVLCCESSQWRASRAIHGLGPNDFSSQSARTGFNQRLPRKPVTVCGCSASISVLAGCAWLLMVSVKLYNLRCWQSGTWPQGCGCQGQLPFGVPPSDLHPGGVPMPLFPCILAGCSDSSCATLTMEKSMAWNEPGGEQTGSLGWWKSWWKPWWKSGTTGSGRGATPVSTEAQRYFWWQGWRHFFRFRRALFRWRWLDDRRGRYRDHNVSVQRDLCG